ncbi:MAG: cell division ATP-binding protein FtsE [Candidatus Ryanbacteria bacterium CG10_big_fil_rev_8_21_14_0_10_43_42]|uniref:Cell division ATP-binding protein FtsE n=1 Tax=Candidatus Ryanbacteria bacterium CG10_big_fil_rev_8_21_14_0_10_43_42 TaxID=1974864 RepID=A0A2M8KX79_9BACT|nr:MAG: cell division ATP-binding protein FtsE [Candidatus Ryanbacteria bacterium CG10_big_fil_rev_8_21_14_0_10_43_42]
MIFFDNVSRIYSGNAIALEGVTLTIEPEEFVSIVGQSGAGKSTLLRLLLAEESPSSGKVFFDSLALDELSQKQLTPIRRRIGTVFQDFRLLPHKTAYENIAFAMEAAGQPDDAIHSDVPQVLELVGLLDKVENFPHELSGGEKQRVAIARAIINRPDVVIADEPTGNLDPLNTWEIIKLLAKINELGTIVLLATHNRDIINALGKRVITLEKGHVVRDEKRGRYVLK